MEMTIQNIQMSTTERQNIINAAVKSYGGKLMSYIRPKVKNSEDAEDILQEVFTKLYCSNKAFETDEHEKRWLIRISINLSKNHLKLFWNKKKQ